MKPTQETKKLKAERISPAAVLGEDQVEELAGDVQARMIRNGDIQFWQYNDTCGAFSPSLLKGVWQVEVFFGERQGGDDPAAEVKSVLTAFWDAEQPEYITGYGSVTWPNIHLHQASGFIQVGLLPLAEGPVITWGWRQCH